MIPLSIKIEIISLNVFMGKFASFSLGFPFNIPDPSLIKTL
jgi:hypothetical protein